MANAWLVVGTSHPTTLTVFIEDENGERIEAGRFLQVKLEAGQSLDFATTFTDGPIRTKTRIGGVAVKGLVDG